MSASNDDLRFKIGHECPEAREYPKSRESLVFPESHGSPECPVSPVSINGQGLEAELKGLAARNACTQTADDAEGKRFKLARDVSGVEIRLARELHISELRPICNEWFSRSEPFLDSGDAFEDHLASFLAELGKVRWPTGEGDTLNKALEAVRRLPISELPMISGMPDAHESWRRIAALHRELSRQSTRKDKTYFLSYRDAAKAFHGLNHPKAYNITLALDRLGVIKIDCKGKAGLNSGKAAEFRYLLSETRKWLVRSASNAGIRSVRARERCKLPRSRKDSITYV